MTLINFGDILSLSGASFICYILQEKRGMVLLGKSNFPMAPFAEGFQKSGYICYKCRTPTFTFYLILFIIDYKE